MESVSGPERVSGFHASIFEPSAMRVGDRASPLRAFRRANDPSSSLVTAVDGMAGRPVAARFPGGEPATRIAPVRRATTVLLAVATMLLCACATPDAPDIGGRWRPVNRFAETPQVIPLQQAYVYQASPADVTLKAMLARWAKDSRVDLSYQHPNDFTLHEPVARIRTTSLEQAAAALSSAYASYGVYVAAERTRIVVSQGLPGDGSVAAGGQGE